MINRMDVIKRKQLSENASDVYTPTDFSKIRIGLKTLQDATLNNIGSYRKINSRCGDKNFVLTAIDHGDLEAMREISNFFYKTSGIYNRMCRYMAYIYRYDWLVTPVLNGGMSVVQDESEIKQSNKNKALESFFKILKVFDEFNVKKFCGDVALKVIRNGCYYGYLTYTSNGKISIQELPPAYCRTRFSINGNPVVEFNMAFFDNFYPTVQERTKVLNLFPDDFRKGYRAYRQGRLSQVDLLGDSSVGWYTLDPANTIKFNINGEDYPMFIAAIPTLIDLDTARDLDQKRMAQKLLRILIQKMPTDKNGDMVFDPDEAQQLHNNAVQMLKKAIGIDVLTTFADVDVADMSDKSNTTQSDDVERVKTSVFDEFGTSIDNFNSSSNAALKYSDLNDASNMYNLLQQFEAFLNRLLEPYNTNQKKVYYTAQILQTTNSNYQDMAKLYREQTQVGFSKMLPQIALGQSQSSILATAYWENEVLNLVEVFVPPMSSSTMNAESLAALTGKNAATGQSGSSSGTQSDSGAGRPEKPDEDKSDKTIANRQSL